MASRGVGPMVASPWSIFTDGGGQGAALTWAQDLISAAGLPNTAANRQFIYDWEVSEGGGGQYNPLNQGPVPGQPQLTTSGQQFGGGAANYASWQAGIQGSVDFLNMPAYSSVLAALKQGNNYAQAESALWASPWASSHYGYGSLWSTSTPPGQATSLAAGGGSVTAGGIGASGSATQTTGFLQNLFGGLFGAGSFLTDPFGAAMADIASAFGVKDFKDLMQRAGLILIGAILIIVGLFMLEKRAISTIVNVTAPQPEEKPSGPKPSGSKPAKPSKPSKPAVTRTVRSTGKATASSAGTGSLAGEAMDAAIVA